MIRLYSLDAAPLADAAIFRLYFAQLSQTRREKLERFRTPEDRRLCLGAGILLDQGLREYGLQEKNMRYGFGVHGKPFFPEWPDIHFSVSHSGSRVIAAFADTPVGCDLEGPRRAEPALVRRFFHPDEAREILAIPEAQAQAVQFLRIWTLKESFLKATGFGLSLPLHSFAICCSGAAITVRQSINDHIYHFAQPDIAVGFACAVCTEDVPCVWELHSVALD